MDNENLNGINELFREFKDQRVTESKNMKNYLDEKNPDIYFKDDKPGSDEFIPSSYLYIRYCEGDDGTRPGPDVPYWISPDLNISPLSSPNAYTTELISGTRYNIECTVHNRGDLNVPSAKIEFFLVTPSLGFDTRYGKNIGLVSTRVNCHESSKVNIQYQILPEDAGHKCLFARVFSFSPEDLPAYDTLLFPLDDRHIGQKNFNIVEQGSTLQLNLLHMPTADVMVQFVPIEREAMLAMRQPSTSYFKIMDKEIMEKTIGTFSLKFSDEIKDSKLSFQRDTAYISIESKDSFSLDEQKKVYSRIQEIAKKILSSGKVKVSDYQNEIELYRKMQMENKVSSLTLQIPKFGLQKGEMSGCHIIATNRISGEVSGGISIGVIG